MPKKQASKNRVSIGPNFQITFLAVMVMMWLSPLVYMVTMATGGGYIGASTWLFQATTMLLPVVFYLVGLLFVWRSHSGLPRLFMAGVVSTLALWVYQAGSSIEQTLRFRFYPPAIQLTEDNSLLTAFGHEWLVMAIGVGAFAAVACWFRLRQKV